MAPDSGDFCFNLVYVDVVSLAGMQLSAMLADANAWEQFLVLEACDITVTTAEH